MTCMYSFAVYCSDLVGGPSLTLFLPQCVHGDVATVSVLCMGVLVYCC